MSTTKRVLIVAGLLIVSFAVSCGLSLLLAPGPQPASASGQAAATEPAEPGPFLALAPAEAESLMPRKKQLEELVREVRTKLAECRQRERLLDDREKQIQISQELLQKDAQKLEDLRVQLVGPLTLLKERLAELAQTAVQIDVLERTNLKKMAKVFDKMDPVNSNRIVVDMCSSGKEVDATKLLFYMSERPVAKLFGEMSTTNKGMAARLMDGLKRMKEKG